ncbi:MAG: hypothetical protein NUV73_00730 [Candidatus Daviesbacteria bacterium]|nr:hypothetical protein [Candidatus Daviesbacteria bacterium]
MTGKHTFGRLNIMSKSIRISSSIVLFAIAILLILAFPAIAQNSSPSAATQTIKEERLNALNTRKQVAQQRLETQKENLQTRIEATRAKIASRAATLKTRLQNFRDQNKAVLAERINTNLNNVNQNQTTRMQSHLDKMSEILDRLEARVNSGKPDIKDPISARAAIESSRTNISTASAAVSAQALEDYTITITSEGRIGLDAKTQRDALHKDLKATRQTVQEAKQSVASAIRIAKSGLIPKESTSSGQ